MPRFMVRRGCSPEQHYWIGSPGQLPAGGGLPVDRTCLLEGGGIFYAAANCNPEHNFTKKEFK